MSAILFDMRFAHSTFHKKDCALLLLAFFNPNLRSLRASLTSCSEAARIFEPELLLPAIAQLAGETRPHHDDPRFEDFRQILTAVDDTLVKALPRLTQAIWGPTKDGVFADPEVVFPHFW